MCNLYTYNMTPAEMRAMRLHYKLVGTTWTEWEKRKRWHNEPIGDIYSNERASVVVLKNGEHVIRDMLWGFSKYANSYGTTFRTPTNPRWKPWLNREHRCIVPASAFAVPHKTTPNGDAVWCWFKRADGLPFFFAGIWRPWRGDRGTKTTPNVGHHALFSIMTTEPNAVVKRVHDQEMPVLLMTADDVRQWLTGSSVEDALAMQKPPGADALVVGR
jgi:putative SOS response-associated peptidase YedK